MKKVANMKRNIKIAVIALILCFALTAFTQAQEKQYYVGSAKSTKYHYTWCKWAKKIKQDNLVVFHSVKEAQDAGYIPCKVCTPPLEEP